MNKSMNKLNLKGRILVILFAIFLIISAVSFNFEHMILAVISFIVVIIFTVLLIIESKKGFK